MYPCVMVNFTHKIVGSLVLWQWQLSTHLALAYLLFVPSTDASDESSEDELYERQANVRLESLQKHNLQIPDDRTGLLDESRL